MRMFITSKNKYLSNDMNIFGTCSIPLIICEMITVDEADKDAEVIQLTGALGTCGYPAWVIKKAITKKIKKKKQQESLFKAQVDFFIHSWIHRKSEYDAQEVWGSFCNVPTQLYVDGWSTHKTR